MNPGRLPDGFAVQLDRDVRWLRDAAGGAVLIGGSPTRLLRLSATARGIMNDGRVVVTDEQSATLARKLLDATVAHPRPANGPSCGEVTAVIPVRDNLAGLLRLLAAVSWLSVVVVDDGSATPVREEDLPQRGIPITVLRHARACGPAAARNTGLAACGTDFVAFLDSDVVPNPGWLERLLGHFTDPTVALVAPRIVGLDGPDGPASYLGRYEAVRSSLDLGRREAPIFAYSPVAYVPSAAVVCRTSMLRQLGGFDETLHSGEDVDLCWRMSDAGMRLRYEPIATVCHEHRRSLGKWLARKAFYGSSAAPLAARHPDKMAPMLISGNAVLTWAMLAAGRRPGLLGAAVAAAAIFHRIFRLLGPHGAAPRDVAVLVVRGLGSAGRQLAAAIWRHYWPLVLPLALLSPRARRVVIAAALADGVVDWRRHTAGVIDPIGLPAYLMLKRADDLAYGVGLWAGALRGRSLASLRPRIRG